AEDHNRRNAYTKRQIRYGTDGNVMELIIRDWSEVRLPEWLRNQGGTVAEGRRIAGISNRAGQGVIGIHAEVFPHALAIADVHAVITGASNGLLIVNAAKHGLSSGNECRGKGFGPAGKCLIDIHGLGLMNTKLMNVFGLNDRVPAQLPTIAEIPGFGIRVAVIGVHQSSHGARVELGRRPGKNGQRISDVPVLKLNPGAGNYVGWVADGKGGLEYGRILLLDHKQRNIHKHLAIIDSISAAKQVLAGAGKVKGKTNSRAEMQVVVVRKAGG